MTDSTWPKNPFWEFSLEVYEYEGVANDLLYFQENLNADINMLLYCIWVAFIGAPALRQKEIDELLLGIEKWQEEIVKPIRRIRTRIKRRSDYDEHQFIRDFYVNMKNIELSSEQIEQQFIYSEYGLTQKGVVEKDDRQILARFNVRLYLKTLGNSFSLDQQKVVDRLLIRVFS